MTDLIQKILLTGALLILGVGCLIAGFICPGCRSGVMLLGLSMGLFMLLLAVFLWQPYEVWISNLRDRLENKKKM